MTANCKSNTIEFGTDSGKATFNVSKETVALVVVCSDLLISLWLWTSLLALQTYHKMVDNDVNKGTLDAPNFSVIME